MFKELIEKNRSYRRFFEEEKIRLDTLKELVELARLSPSSANRQLLKFILSCEEPKNEKIFETLFWAGYLKDWNGPEKGEKPTAYIVILGDREIGKSFGVDPGIVAQSMLLGAVEKGLGGCVFGSIAKEKLAVNLELDERFEILLVLALGKPREKIVIDEVGSDGDIKYWRDENQTHHVPKRKLEDLIID